MKRAFHIGGLSFGGRTNTGDLSLAAYHPRWSITWVWFAHVTTRPGRGYSPTFSKAERERMARLYREGNPHASKPRWYHVFWQPAGLRQGQWSDYVRLPFGRTLIIGHQKAMRRKGDPA